MVSLDSIRSCHRKGKRKGRKNKKMNVAAFTEAEEVGMGGPGTEGKGKMPARGGRSLEGGMRCRSWRCL